MAAMVRNQRNIEDAQPQRAELVCAIKDVKEAVVDFVLVNHNWVHAKRMLVAMCACARNPMFHYHDAHFAALAGSRINGSPE